MDYHGKGGDQLFLSSHCLGCKAGLVESWLHIGSVLFYLEGWTKKKGKLWFTQVKCFWLLPTYVDHVEYARVQDINFTSAKKMKGDLDEKTSNISDFPFTNYITQTPFKII